MPAPRALWSSLLASLAALAAPDASLAVPPSPPAGPSPVSFAIEPAAGSTVWRWTLRNVTDRPVEVATDRRLVWFEVAPGPAAAGRRGPSRAARCVHDARPTRTEGAARTLLAPGQSYSERVDLRDTCALRLPAGLVAGAAVVAHYGFAPLPARGTSPARWRARTLVVDALPYPVNDLTAAVTAPSLPAPPAADAPAAPGLTLVGRGAQAAAGEGLTAAVTLRNEGPRPRWTLFRTAMFGFELETPAGRAVRCDQLARETSPFRELFVRLGAGGGRAARLAVAEFCPAGALDEAGIYQARAVFESRADGQPWLTGEVFTGRLRSAPFVLRVSRGRARYRPLGLVIAP
jgi:hypothetical protein